MPIIDVLLVMPDQAALEAGATQAIADAIGKCLNAKPGHVWVRLRPLPLAFYAENEADVEPESLPVFVSVLHRVLPDSVALQSEAAALSRAIAECLARPDHAVHIEYAPAGIGRLAFGGYLVQ